MERPELITSEIYHVFNRGVEKRRVFLNAKDHLRFIHDLTVFNDEAPAINVGYSFIQLKSPDIFKPSKTQLVDILSFCLMPNHYHLFLRQLVDGGVTEFMRKMGTGYTNYFNLKYQRVGPLFQGKFKVVHIRKQHHLLYLPHYIHLNPLDLFMPKWREEGIKDHRQALRFLKSYRWSSYLDIIGTKNFPSVINKDFFAEIYGDGKKVNYQNEITEWLRDMDFAALRDVMLD